MSSRGILALFLLASMLLAPLSAVFAEDVLEPALESPLPIEETPSVIDAVIPQEITSPLVEEAANPPEDAEGLQILDSVELEEEPELVWGCVEGAMDNEGNPVEQCGLGYYRELCWDAGNGSICETFFEIYEEESEEPNPLELDKESLFTKEYLSLSLEVDGVALLDGELAALPLGTERKIQWSYTEHAPDPFAPFNPNNPISFPDALAASTLTFQVYRGDIGSATLIHSEEIPYGTFPEIPLALEEAGRYIFVLSSTYPKDTYPPGLALCEGGGGDICPVYQTRIDDFTWFMENGQALYDDVENEIDADRLVTEDGVRVSRMSRFRPMAFGMVTVEIEEAPQSTVSNVLFLPGIKGSRLYDTNGNKLWEPEGNQDVERLFLTSAGIGANPGIHTKSGDIIETIAGFSEIYGSFIRSMNELRAVKEWRIVSYDWRLSLDDIVNKGAVREDNIYFDETADISYLELNLLELASSSPTHKVTIVAHSNGGLVAKKLMMKLGDAETARLIDKVIFVGVPQSGAPQALGALLFGYKESLPSWFPFIVHTSTARTFAENSPMGYHLLPSQRYFDDVFDQEHAVVRFKAANTYAEERAEYGDLINTWEELRAFSLAEDNGRIKPEAVVFSKPNVLNEFLLTYAKRTHDSIDAWVPPAGVTLYQIGGWGVDTVSGIEFYEFCVLSVCKKEYRPMFVEDGDGVVPIPSALMVNASTENVRRYWLDLNAYRLGPFGLKNHGNILSTPDLQIFLRNILLNDSSLPENILTGQPAASVAAKQLRFMLHSPLTLNLYDTSGNHAGPTESGDPEETIPGSVYGQFGEVQYITVPAGPEYTVEMNGVAPGTFSLDIQEVSGGSIVAASTLANVPTQAGTVATMTIGDSLETISSLSVDSDGNGSTDFLLPVAQDSTSFYQAPVVPATERTSSSGNNKSSAISQIQETSNAIAEPSLGLPTTPVAQQQPEQATQVARVIQKEPAVTTQPADSKPSIDRYSQIASPLSAFYEVKDILISMLVGVYHFMIRIGGFLFTR